MLHGFMTIQPLVWYDIWILILIKFLQEVDKVLRMLICHINNINNNNNNNNNNLFYELEIQTIGLMELVPTIANQAK